MEDNWAMLAAAVCEVAVDDYRKAYARYLRAEPFEKGAYLRMCEKLKREMNGQLFWDLTTDAISFEQAVRAVEKQEDERWLKEREEE